jgi:cytochrome c oxidase subunit 4
MSHSPTDHAQHAHPTLGTYAAVYVALMILLAATVIVGKMELGTWSFAAAATIATIKAVLIMLIFMHVRYGSPLIWLVAAAGFFWMAILFSLTLSDFLTREMPPIGY